MSMADPANTDGSDAGAANSSTLLGGDPADPAATADPVDPATTADPAAPADPDNKNADDKPVVPETYEDFTVPEGFEANEAHASTIQALGKDLGLTQEQAQKLYARTLESDKLSSEQAERQFAEQNEQWHKEFMAQPDANEKLGFAKKALDRLATTEEERQFLTGTLGNHPVILSILEKAGRVISDDTFVERRTLLGGDIKGEGLKKSDADVLYGQTPKR